MKVTDNTARTHEKRTPPAPVIGSGLVGPEELLRDFFRKPVCDASMKWLYRQRKRRAIPSIVLGRDVFFDIDAVRVALVKRTLQAR